MKLIINGTEHEVWGPYVTHEKICELAGQPDWASVAYSCPRQGDSRRTGTTYKGKTVDLEDGTHITCLVTGSA